MSAASMTFARATRFARLWAATKAKAQNGYNWSLQNQIIVAGSLGVAGPIGAAVIIVHDNRKGHRDAKQDADQKRQELNRFFDEKFSVLQEANLNTQRLILACASGTLKGFQGDMTEIESFVKSFEVFEKAMGCAKVDGRGEQ